MKRHLILFFLLCELTACGGGSGEDRRAPAPVSVIPLAGQAAAQNAELSGLAWHNDNLILLPQYPNRFAAGTWGSLFLIPKEELLRWLDSDRSGALTPRPVQCVSPDLAQLIPGFEGVESLGFVGDRVFLTIESSGSGMQSYVVEGDIAPDSSRIVLDAATLHEVPLPTQIENASYEALVVGDNELFLLYEGNGRNVNPSPQALHYDLTSLAFNEVPFPTVEYRITDATPLRNGDFWAINFFYPGDASLYLPGPDSLEATPGDERVERIVKFHYADGKITLSQDKPVVLELPEGDISRNWEGLALLDDRGFLLTTDRFPSTILAFVAH